MRCRAGVSFRLQTIGSGGLELLIFSNLRIVVAMNGEIGCSLGATRGLRNTTGMMNSFDICVKKRQMFSRPSLSRLATTRSEATWM
jgi:hypothetical protein